MELESGVLYVVATPLGNLEDISPRALSVLRGATVIAAEDTRHSGQLLRHFGISTPLLSLHEHNEMQRSALLLQRLQRGEAVALISDAGTPLIADPGFVLVRAARHGGIRVVPIPGPCALIAALSVAGLPADRFAFEGFLPAKAAARTQRLEELQGETRTLVFYETPHRILGCLTAMSTVFGGQRAAVLARELTKLFETIRAGTLAELCTWLQADPQQRRGEFVVVVRGAEPIPVDELGPEATRTLRLLLAELPLKRAVTLAAELTGRRRNTLYALAIALQEDQSAP